MHEKEPHLLIGLIFILFKCVYIFEYNQIYFYPPNISKKTSGSSVGFILLWLTSKRSCYTQKMYITTTCLFCCVCKCPVLGPVCYWEVIFKHLLSYIKNDAGQLQNSAKKLSDSFTLLRAIVMVHFQLRENFGHDRVGLIHKFFGLFELVTQP